MILIYSVVMVAWGVFSLGFFGLLPSDSGVVNVLRYVPVLTLSASALAWLRRTDWWPRVRHQLDRHTAAVDTIPIRRVGWAIAAAAGIGLFAELMIIRLHSSYFQVFAYFKNVSLISCFLGLGIGYTIGKRSPLFTPLVLPAFALQILYMHGLDVSELGKALQNPVAEELSFGSVPATGAALPVMYAFFVAVFAFNALTFVPLGQLASRLMSRMPPLVSYGWNLGGSLAGIGVFYLLAAVWAPPVLWIAVAAVPIVAFVWTPRSVLAASGTAGILLIGVLSLPTRTAEVSVHSPYQLLTLTMDDTALPKLEVSHVYYQNAMNLDSAEIAGQPPLQQVQRHYELPYRLRPRPEHVLVVGAGLGNDVAAALRADAGAVHAVEIDPAILRFGRRLHPESPFQDPRVTATVEDARAFIRHTQDRYDLIVYGMLDSHSLLTHGAGVRLDSYVYTVEAFREAREHLTENGLICLTFSLLTQQLGTKLYRMLTDAFDGVPPHVYRTGYNYAFAFVAGEEPATRNLPLPEGVRELPDLFAGTGLDVDVSTDDWPFFYMPSRTYPISYALMVGILLAVSLLLIGRITPGAGRGLSWPCFFLGAGFMLIETKAITQLALVYGSTWIVIGATIAAVLVLAFAANWVVIRWGTLRSSITYGLLLVSILVGLLLSSFRSAALPIGVGRIVFTTALTLPLFFSGIAFSTELKRGTPVAVALSSNLMGAILGGFLEYNAMYFGFTSLYFVALGIYVLAFVTAGRRLAGAVGALTARSA